MLTVVLKIQIVPVAKYHAIRGTEGVELQYHAVDFCLLSICTELSKMF